MCINAPEDSQGADDSDSNTIPNNPLIRKFITHQDIITQVLDEELTSLYPASNAYENAELSVSFVSPDEIRDLNKTYRDTDEATDVLSFPLIDDEAVDVPELPVLSLGDIVICPEETLRLHSELDPFEAVCLMTSHSFLHLLGYDHEDENTQAEMWALQDSITAKIMGRFSR